MVNVNMEIVDSNSITVTNGNVQLKLTGLYKIDDMPNVEEFTVYVVKKSGNDYHYLGQKTMLYEPGSDRFDEASENYNKLNFDGKDYLESINDMRDGYMFFETVVHMGGGRKRVRKTRKGRRGKGRRLTKRHRK